MLISYLYCISCVFQVNVSELGLVTPAGKVVWGMFVLGLFFDAYMYGI